MCIRDSSCGVSPLDGSVTLISIVLEPHDIDRRYVHYLFRSNPWVEEFYRNGRGIVADLWTTNYQQMKGMMLPYPPVEEQEEIVGYLDKKCGELDQAVGVLEKQVECLKELKQSMIADFVTGKRRIRL